MAFKFLHFLEITGLNLRSESKTKNHLHLTPFPQKVEPLHGSIEFSNKIEIHSTISEAHSFIIDQFMEELTIHIQNQIKFKNTFITAINEDYECSEFDLLKLIDNLPQLEMKKFEEQGYILVINAPSQSITIWASTAQGIFYGIQTLYQLFNQKLSPNRCIVPSVIILDYPDMEFRGISDDVSRGQAATVEGYKRFIRELSRFKMNHYFMYIEDVVEIEGHPEIGKDRGRLSKIEIQEISAFAKNYFITFSPIVESLGHLDNILSLPEYVDLAEFPGSDCLDVSNPKIYPFLEDIYSSITDSFQSCHFHVACDESQELGFYRSKDYIKKVGKEQAYITHYQKIYDLAKAAGNENIYIYHDIPIKFDKVLQNLPKEYIFVYWNYGNGKKGGVYPEIDKLMNNGFKTIVSPATHDWARFFPDISSMETNTEI